MSGSSSLHTRIASLKEWLELHFGVILERAQECRVHVDTQEGDLVGRHGSSANQAGKGNQRRFPKDIFAHRVCLDTVIVPSSAEELLYKHALSLAKEGAVKELLGQSARGLDLYCQAKLMMEALVGM